MIKLIPQEKCQEDGCALRAAYEVLSEYADHRELSEGRYCYVHAHFHHDRLHALDSDEPLERCHFCDLAAVTVKRDIGKNWHPVCRDHLNYVSDDNSPTE